MGYGASNIRCSRFAALHPDELQVATSASTEMCMDSDEVRARAEAAFRKGQQAREGASALIEHEKQARAKEEKIARLRALRLANEAAKKSPSRHDSS